MGYNINAWLERQPEWVQEAVLLLKEKGRLVDGDIERLVSILKGKTKRTHDTAGGTTGESAPVSNLKLLELKDIQGVERLQSRKPLSLGTKNLTIIYGRNGSGKSGYTRLLKRICGKSVTPLKSNIYADAVSAQTCTISYKLDDREAAIEWEEGKVSETNVLENVDIFDNQSEDVYLVGEHGVDYVPREINLFRELANCYGEIRNRLAQERSNLQSKLPHMPRQYEGTTIAAEYNQLMLGTVPQKIEEFTNFTQQQANDVANLSERLTTKDPSASAKRQRDIKSKIDQLKTRVTEFALLSSPSVVADIRGLVRDARERRQQVNEGALALKEHSNLNGVGQSIWKSLWEAARRYSVEVAYQGRPFPNVDSGARCVLCHQELTPGSRDRLKHFEDFVQGDLEKKASEAEQKRDERLHGLPNVDSQESVKERCELLSLEDGLCQSILEFYEQTAILVQGFKKGEIPSETSRHTQLSQEIIAKLDAVSATLERRALEFEKDAESFDREMIQGKLLNLQARQWVSQQKEAIEQELERLEKVHQYEKWERETNTNGLTREAGEATKALVTNAYIVRFNDELRKLGAAKIQVELKQSRSSRGESFYCIGLKNMKQSSSPVEILSEGERRIVSLAAFLANVTGRDRCVPFIFDDPISSLDQDFEEKVAIRLAELSKDRQVIVFTHRLSLLSLLSDQTHHEDNSTTVCISNESWGTGYPDEFLINCSKSSIRKALNNFRNERITRMKKILEEQGTYEYSIYAQSMCSSFRILIEKSVECLLLADVVQRHRRAINTQGKIYKLAGIEKSDCEFIDKMMSKYSCYEHSQSPEIAVIPPSPEEFEADVNRMFEWYEGFEARMKKITTN